MLRESAQSTGRSLRLSAIADGADPMIAAGTELMALGGAGATVVEVDIGDAESVARRIDPAAAVDAAAVAAAFEGLNRIVDGVGLPVGRASRRDRGDIIPVLGLAAFPHASHGT